jgi:hypothetical protein
MKNKFIHRLFEIVIYVFPLLFLFFALVGFQLWKLEGAKKDMVKHLHNSTEIIDAARIQLLSIRKDLITTNDSMNNYIASTKEFSKPTESVPDRIDKQLLVELSMNVLNRVAELKNKDVDFQDQTYVIKQPTGRYFAVIISYSQLGYAVIQREHLKSLGFNNVKILETDKHYALSIEDASEKTDLSLHHALEKWNENFNTQSDAYIKKF